LDDGFRCRRVEQDGGSLADRGKDSSGITQPEGVFRKPRDDRQATLHGVVFDILAARAPQATRLGLTPAFSTVIARLDRAIQHCRGW
jgi:hypothetical protein